MSFKKPRINITYMPSFAAAFSRVVQINLFSGISLKPIKLLTAFSVFLAVSYPAMAVADSIQTLFKTDSRVTGTGGGYFFEIENTSVNDVVIDSWAVNTITHTSVNVWTHFGGYAGYEKNIIYWTLLGTDNAVVSQGNGVPTPVAVGGLVIKPGETYGIAMEGNGSWISSDPLGNSVYSNETLELRLGSSQNFAFGASLFLDDIWNGIVYYTVASSDVSITKTDGVISAVPGTSLTYTIVADNAGPGDDPAVTVMDTFPADLACSYTSVNAAGATGNTAADAGNLNETLNMPAGSSVTYTAICDIASGATGTLSNTATITGSFDDPAPDNNSATDDDTVLTPQSDVSITKTDGVAVAVPGSNLTYTIVASNAGPSDETIVGVVDFFPDVLTCTWTSVAAMGASGNTQAETPRPIYEALFLPAGGIVTYTATCDIDSEAAGTISNTAKIAGSFDPNPDNDSATDTDTLEQFILDPTQPYLFLIKASNSGWCIDDGPGGDELVRACAQSDLYIADLRESDGSYRIVSVRSGKHLHLDESGDELLSTRYQPDDDFTRFFFEPQAGDDSYRIKVKATGKYLHADESSDQLLSTRYQTDDDFTRFYLNRPNPVFSNGFEAGAD